MKNNQHGFVDTTYLLVFMFGWIVGLIMMSAITQLKIGVNMWTQYIPDGTDVSRCL